MKNISILKKTSIGLVFLFILLFYFFSVYNFSIHHIVDNNGGDKIFTIQSGENVGDIVDNLASERLINSEFFFKLYIWQTKNDSKFQAGVYKFDKGMSMVEIVDKLTRGDVLDREVDIKILEGWRLSDMEEYFVKNNFLDKGEFSRKAKTTVDNWPFSFTKPDFLQNLPRESDLEGYIFPDTYRIFDSASAEEIIKKTLDNFGNKLSQELRGEIKKQGKSIHSIVTMASIIEKEVISKDDMAVVAGILYKRMRVGMRLEVDSSVNYISGKSDPSISYTDLQIDSPYNTYKYDGLPPGPICSPSLRAIKAAIYPKESPYFFYLNRQDTGETIFSKDYNEHIRNKNKYLK